MTSPRRPEYYPNTTSPYPFYELRNKTTTRVGSGQIDIYKFTDGHGVDSQGRERDLKGIIYSSEFSKSTETCPCKKCKDSYQPNNVWWEIFVHSSAHVVFDDVEASHTYCRLFFDEQDCPIVKLDEMIVDYIDMERDKCVLKYVTCDSLGNDIYNLALKRAELCLKVYDKYFSQSESKLTFIVSHPHGCHKQVSIGSWEDNYKVSEYNENFDNTKLTYTTCTCPGSSGAPVYCLRSTYGHIHRGALDSGLNYSDIGLYSK